MSLKWEHEIYNKNFETKSMYSRLCTSRKNEIKKMKIKIENKLEEINDNKKYRGNEATDELKREIKDILKMVLCYKLGQ